jgi:outer membrane protein TolC
MRYTKKNIVWIVLFCFLLTGFKAPGEGEEKIQPGEETATEKAVKLFGPRSREMMRLTLDECVDRALTYNLELQAADYGIATAEEKRVEVNRIGYPILDYEYRVAPAPKDASRALESFFSGELAVFNRFKLGVGVPIHTFGKVKKGKELAETGIEAEREKKEQKKSDVVFKVKQLYYGILLAREVNRLLRSARNGVQDEIDKREEQGGTDPSELLKLKLFRAELEKRIEEGDKKEILAKEALRVQLGIDPTIRFDLATDKLRPAARRVGSYEEYRRQALEQRSELKLVELGYQAKKKQYQLEKRLMAPNLAAGAFFEIGRTPGVRNVAATDDFLDPFNFTRAGVGLELKGQLDLHTSLSKVRQARSEMHKVDVQKELAEDGVELEVKEAFLEVRNTQLDIQRAEEAGKLSRQLLFLTQSNYDIGLAEPKDLIDALQAFLQSRGQYFEAVFYHNVAVAKLDQKIGRMPE